MKLPSDGCLWRQSRIETQDYAYCRRPNTECIICTHPCLNTATLKLYYKANEEKSMMSAWPRHDKHVDYVKAAAAVICSSAGKPNCIQMHCITCRCRSPGRVMVSVRVKEMPFILSAIACAYQKQVLDVLQVRLYVPSCPVGRPAVFAPPLAGQCRIGRVG